MVVLHLIHGNSKQPDAFDRRGVDEFHKFLGLDCWHNIEFRLNPAEVLSRGFYSQKYFTMNDSFKGHHHFPR